ncbi:AEC family transporter [Tepidicaulis sp. LMO-SS28]|uniref:AEC family transporter n=1 Tax=Tepidicaulis sp. LMO-SS28 TaxID=3447455 RepID=UPI003EE0F665
MEAGLTLVLPIFGVIGVGILAAKFGILSEKAIDGIDRFAFTFALPALLFRALANTELPGDLPWGLWLSYYGGVLIVWALAGVTALLLLRRSPADAVMAGFGGGFSNTVMLGIPIILTAYGEEAGVPLFFILAFHGLTVFSIATFLLETTKPRGGVRLTPVQIIGESLKGMVTNPIIVALACGITYGQIGPEIPKGVDTVLEMFARTGIPCALFTLGAMLTRYEIKRSIGTAAVMSFFKLAIHPVIVFVLAYYVFALPDLWLKVAVTMAAMPTGVFCFVLSSRYDAAPGAASSNVVLSTALSLLTLTLVLNIFL